MTPSEELHLQSAAYANRRKEAYLDQMKQGSVEKLSREILDWLWLAHYEGYRDGQEHERIPCGQRCLAHNLR
jgi:hypothetical protein